MQTDILIVGGGLSGLSLARDLEKNNRDYRLLESRDRFGGRIVTETVKSKNDSGYFDLGPAWFWPGQPRMEKLINELKLHVFEQYSIGALLFEDEQGQVFKDAGYSSMAGSYRLMGGFSALIDAMTKQLTDEHLYLKSHVTEVKQHNSHLLVSVKKHDDFIETVQCNKVVLALPPRLAADSINYSPELDKRVITSMRGIPTWMAGQAKIMAVYETPFWRDSDLSGDVMSRRGPMVEIHDASPVEDGPYALFGFVGYGVNARKDREEALRHSAQEQLVRLFGKQASQPIKLIMQDWAFEAETATELDAIPLGHHPAYGLPEVLSQLWDNQLIIGSTEIAESFGGYLEGALEASESISKNI